MKLVVARISVRNLQRKVAVDVVDLENFAAKALRLCLQLPRKNAELLGLPEIAVLIGSEARIAALHRKSIGEAGPTDVITFQHAEAFVSAAPARPQPPHLQGSLYTGLMLDTW